MTADFDCSVDVFRADLISLISTANRLKATSSLGKFSHISSNICFRLALFIILALHCIIVVAASEMSSGVFIADGL